jgi:alpha-glucosidase
LRASETGAPVQRPLVFDYQYDPTVRDVDDEFLLGPDLLVAPVVNAGVTARHVYLPPGSWYDWHTGDLIDGSRFLLAQTPMDRIPIYARGGAVIPMWPEAPPSTAGYHPSAIELHLFVPGSDGAHGSFLQEDDGLSLAALHGARYRTQFKLTRDGGEVRLSAEVEGEGYAEFAREAFHLVIHGASPDTVQLDGTELLRNGGHFVLPNTGSGFTIAFDL